MYVIYRQVVIQEIKSNVRQERAGKGSGGEHR